MENADNRQRVIRLLESDFQITGAQLYLLPVIPLVEMVWADGQNQAAELNLVSDFIERHLGELNEKADGVRVVSHAEVESFMDRFVRTRPSSALLKAIRELALPTMLGHSDETQSQVTKQVLDYCLDIAAASVNEYPYEQRDRFMDEEKALLHELAAVLNVKQSEEA